MNMIMLSTSLMPHLILSAATMTPHSAPTTMAAMLNSFRMGFRSAALSQRSGDVWNTLMRVTTEFEKYEETVERTQKHLQMAQKDIDELIGPRTRQIRKALAELTEEEV